MMRADYDSKADALSIDLVATERWDGVDHVDDDFCNVAFSNGRPANVELLYPRDHLDLLEVAAQHHDLDATALIAAAQAALAAPDRPVTLDVGSRIAA
jgi:hypothetical protein